MNLNVSKNLVPVDTGNSEKKRRLKDVDEKLLRFGAIKTEDHDFVKLSKITCPNNFQNKALNSFDKLGK